MAGRDNARRFHFLREIASGGFGSVYLAKVMHADGFSRLVAIKVLKSQWSDSEEVARRMRDEARLLGLLRHRNIVDVIDLTSIDGRAAVIMEYLEAVDLRCIGQHLVDTGQPMPVKASLEIAAAAASALDAAYNRPPIPGDKPLRVIHRDIKPSNIMIDETGMVKVLDFGVARSDIDNRESQTQDLQFGSVDYMAPERLFFEPETPASDVYSLAATLFEVLALEKLGKAKGRPARHASFVADRLSNLRGQLDIRGMGATELEALLRTSLEFNHEDRPSAAEFFQQVRALSRLVDDEDLGSWAERLLPDLIRKSNEAPREPSQFTDSVVTEDSILFAMGEIVGDSDGRPIPGSVAVQPGAPLPDGGLHPDASLGDEVRQGALAELDDSNPFVPLPVTGTPVGTGGGTLVPADPEEWDDSPTSVREPAGEAQVLAPVVQTPDPADPFEVQSTWDTVQPDGDDAVVDPADLVTTFAPRAALVEPADMPTVTALALSSTPSPAAIDDLGPTVVTADLRAEAQPGRKPPPRPEPPPPLAVVPETTMPRPQPVVATAGMAPAGQRQEPTSARPAPPKTAPPKTAPPKTAPPKTAPPKTAPPNTGSRILPVVLLGGCLGFLVVVAGVTTVFALDVGGVTTRLFRLGADSAVEPAPDAPSTPVPPGPAMVEGPALRFVSDLPDTRKLVVQCDTEVVRGTVEVVVPGASAKTCTVTAHLPDRSRLTAVVDAPSEGAWNCFAGGVAQCQRQ